MKVRTRLLGIVVALALSAAACGGGKAPDPTAKPAATTATTATNPQGEVLTAYNEYNRFYDEVVANPDPNNPVLASHLTGDALNRMRLDQAGFQSTHEGVRFTDESFVPVVVSIDPSGGRAVVDDCAGAIAHYFDVRTGQAEGAPPLTKPSREGFEFVFVKEAGRWKLSEKHSKPSACPRP